MQPESLWCHAYRFTGSLVILLIAIGVVGAFIGRVGIERISDLASIAAC